MFVGIFHEVFYNYVTLLGEYINFFILYAAWQKVMRRAAPYGGGNLEKDMNKTGLSWTICR